MEKFFDAEQLFFWFTHSLKAHIESLASNRIGYGAGRYKIQLIEVQVVLQQLVDKKKLTPEMVDVMGKCAKKRYAPRLNSLSAQERKDAETWLAAMDVLNTEFRRRGWVEKA